MDLYKALENLYQDSFIKKIFSTIKTCLSRGFLNSRFKKIFYKLEIYLSNSFITRLGGWIFSIVDRIIEIVSNFSKNHLSKSASLSGLNMYTSDICKGFRFVYLMLIFISGVFGIFFVLSDIILNPVYLLIPAIIGLVGLRINGREKDILLGSHIINFIIDIFSEDEKGEMWW